MLTLPKIREQLKPHAEKFVEALLELVEDEDWRARNEAVKTGMAYLFGKPEESIERQESAAVRIILHEDGRGVLEPKPALPPNPETIDGVCSDDAELSPAGDTAELPMRYDSD